MKKLLFALISTITASPYSYAVGLFDPGLNNPTVRTDYANASVGVQTPLTWDSLCHANNRQHFFGGGLLTPCVTSSPSASGADLFYHSGYFDQSNFFSCSEWNNLTNDCSNPLIGTKHWTLLMNNEPWHVQNLAPPNQSLPRARPGEGTMGFAMYNDPTENIWRAHFVNNNLFANPNPYAQGAIPFMALAIDSKANGATLGYLNDPTAPSVLSFTSKIWAAGTAEPGDKANAFNHYVYAFSEWGGKRRGLFMNVFWGTITYGAGLKTAWNWQAKQSFQRNGGDLALFNLGPESNNACAGLMNQTAMQFVGEQRPYSIDLNSAFRCASNLGLFDEPMPLEQQTPIVELGFAVETSHYNYMWATVHGIHLDPAANICLPWTCANPAKSAQVDAKPNSAFTQNILSLLSAECQKKSRCASNKRQAFSQQGLESKFLRSPGAVVIKN